MKSLLDKFVPATDGFHPETATELFALRLAQKLGEAQAVRHFVALAETYSSAQLVCAYRRTLRGNGNGDRGRRFHDELKRIHAGGNHDRQSRLISIRVERRAVAASVFHDEHLEFVDARQLSSAHDKAINSAVGFINWMVERFPVESAALEAVPNGYEFQRRVLHNAICQTLRERILPMWEIPKVVLLESYGYPQLKTRAQLRRVATSVWPILEGTHAKVFMQDAAILGLHVQIERLFTIN